MMQRSVPSTQSYVQHNSGRYRPSSEIRQSESAGKGGKRASSSETKPHMTVIYDEFKYFSRPFEINEYSQNKQIEMINI